MKRKTGILLTNTGTPDAPTPSAVRRYLKEFLSDKRVVKIPHIIWLPILYGLILPFRSKKSAGLYQRIWTDNESPMRRYMQQITVKLQASMPDVVIELGMNYGNPSIANALEKLKQHKIDDLIVLPLFPQYSNTTTASSFDRVMQSLRQWPALPALNLIRDYAAHPDYIAVLAESVKNSWQVQDKHHLLISFHGLPKRFTEAGDPYQEQCETTASLLAAALELKTDEWTLCYQSQFGYDKWLQPSTQKLIETLPKQGIKEIDIICPGFSVDCLETLEEIAIRGREDYLAAGGKELRLISALNDNDNHIRVLREVLQRA